MSNLTVKPLGHSDIHHIVNYWTKSEPAFLEAMGVDLSKLPEARQLKSMLISQLKLPIEERTAYCVIWFEKNQAIGHCNTNPTSFGQEAHLHLHIWNSTARKKGMGTELIKMSLPYFFNDLQLKTLWSEPYSPNEAPSKTLEKAGFEFIKEYQTIPGSYSSEQAVKQWKMTSSQFKAVYT